MVDGILVLLTCALAPVDHRLSYIAYGLPGWRYRTLSVLTRRAAVRRIHFLRRTGDGRAV